MKKKPIPRSAWHIIRGTYLMCKEEGVPEKESRKIIETIYNYARMLVQDIRFRQFVKKK